MLSKIVSFWDTFMWNSSIISFWKNARIEEQSSNPLFFDNSEVCDTFFFLLKKRISSDHTPDYPKVDRNINFSSFCVGRKDKKWLHMWIFLFLRDRACTCAQSKMYHFRSICGVFWSENTHCWVENNRRLGRWNDGFQLPKSPIWGFPSHFPFRILGSFGSS
jgi:hypothetical protein